jgi:phage terminase large subunit
MPRLVDLSRLPDITNDAYLPLYECRARHLVIRGGAGSGKSYWAPQKLLYRIIVEGAHRFVALRKVARTLKVSVVPQIRQAIQQFGVGDLWAENKSDHTFTYQPNGGQILCAGLDDVEKMKSIHEPTGLWLEEATEFTEYDLTQLDLRMRGQNLPHTVGQDGVVRPGYYQSILTFNPISALHHIKRRFWDTAHRPGDVKLVTTTYRDNRFLDAEYGRILEELRDRDEMLWQVYACGEWGILEGLVYGAFQTPEVWPPRFDEVFYGLDFGYNNPMALLEIGMNDAVPYVTERLYERNLTTTDLIARMREMNIAPASPVYCDAAEPDRIQELCNAGYNAVPGGKGQGSVTAGINFVKGLGVHTRPENVNLNKEALSYKWQADKNGDLMDTPVKAFDHALDALRYALHTHLGKESPAVAIGGLDVDPRY